MVARLLLGPGFARAAVFELIVGRRGCGGGRHYCQQQRQQREHSAVSPAAPGSALPSSGLAHCSTTYAAAAAGRPIEAGASRAPVAAARVDPKVLYSSDDLLSTVDRAVEL